MKNHNPRSINGIHLASIRAIRDKFFCEPAKIDHYIYCLGLCSDYMSTNKLTWEDIGARHTDEVITFAKRKSDINSSDYQHSTLTISWLLEVIGNPPTNKFDAFSNFKDNDEYATLFKFMFWVMSTSTFPLSRYLANESGVQRYIKKYNSIKIRARAKDIQFNLAKFNHRKT